MLTHRHVVWHTIRLCYLLNESDGRALINDDNAVLIGLLLNLLRVWIMRCAETVGTEPFQQCKISCYQCQVQPSTTYLQSKKPDTPLYMHPATPYLLAANYLIHHAVNTCSE